eukprot:g3880.t1
MEDKYPKQRRKVLADRKMKAEDANRYFLEKLSFDFKKVMNAFQLMDADGNGGVDRDEFRAMLGKYHIHLSDKEFERFCKLYPCLDDNYIDFKEFRDTFGDIVNAKVDFERAGLDPHPKPKPTCRKMRAMWCQEANTYFLDKLRGDFARVVRPFEDAACDDDGYTAGKGAKYILLSEIRRVLSASCSIELKDKEWNKFVKLYPSLLAAKRNAERKGESKMFVEIASWFHQLKDKVGLLSVPTVMVDRHPKPKPKPRGAQPMTADEADRFFLEKLKGDFQDCISAFRASDKDGSGKIEQHEFRSMLSKYHINMTDSEFQRFCRRYPCLDDGMIDFNEFRETFNKVLQMGYGSTALRDPYPMQKRKPRELGFMQAQEANRFFLEKFASDRQKVLKDFQSISDAEYGEGKGVKGAISLSGFRKLMELYHIKINNAEFRKLCLRYSSLKQALSSPSLPDEDGGSISFFDFRTEFERKCRVGDMEAESGVYDRHPKERPKPRALRHMTAEEADKYFIERVYSDFNNVCMQFRNFDTLGHGSIEQDEFRKMLQEKYHIHMSDVEFGRFCKRYKCLDKSVIEFKEFREVFENVVRGPKPRLMVDSHPKPKFSARETRSMMVEEANLYFLEKLRSAFKKEMTALRSVALAPSNDGIPGVFTLGRFRQFLASRFVLKMSNAEFRKFCLKYRTLTPIGMLNGGEQNSAAAWAAASVNEAIDVNKFMSELHDVVIGTEANMISDPCPQPKPKARESRKLTAEEANRYFMEKLHTDFSKVLHAFQAIDRDHSGYIDKEELRYMLSKYHINLSDAEFTRFCNMHRCFANIENSYSKDDEGGKVSLKEFRKTFATLLMQPQNGGDDGRAARKIQLMSADKAEKIFLDKLGTSFGNAMIVKAFQQADKLRKGSVAKSDFRKLLARYNIVMSDDDFVTFCAKYPGCLDQENIPYSVFKGNFGRAAIERKRIAEAEAAEAAKNARHPYAKLMVPTAGRASGRLPDHMVGAWQRAATPQMTPDSVPATGLQNVPEETVLEIEESQRNDDNSGSGNEKGTFLPEIRNGKVRKEVLESNQNVEMHRGNQTKQKQKQNYRTQPLRNGSLATRRGLHKNTGKTLLRDAFQNKADVEIPRLPPLNKLKSRGNQGNSKMMMMNTWRGINNDFVHRKSHAEKLRKMNRAAQMAGLDEAVKQATARQTARTTRRQNMNGKKVKINLDLNETYTETDRAMERVRPEVYWQWKTLRREFADNSVEKGRSTLRKKRVSGPMTRRKDANGKGISKDKFCKVLTSASEKIEMEDAKYVAEKYAVGKKKNHVDYNSFIKDAVSFFGQ